MKQKKKQKNTMENNLEDSSGLYEASGLKAVIEEVERMKEEEKKKNEELFWVDLSKDQEDIDPFWLT